MEGVTGEDEEVKDGVGKPSGRLLLWQVATVILFCIGYMCIILTRNDLPAVLPLLLSDNSAVFEPDTDEGSNGEGLLNENQQGLLLAVGTGAYLMGKLTTGMLVDYVGGGRVTLALGIFLSSLGSIGIAFVSLFPLICIFWGGARYFQAMGWPSIAKLIYNWFEPRQYARIWSITSMASRSGSILTGLFISLLIQFAGYGWREVLWTCGGVGVGVAVVVACLLRDSPVQVGLPPVCPGENGKEGEDESVLLDGPDKEPAAPDGVGVTGGRAGPSVWSEVHRFVREPRFWLMAFALAMMTALFEWEAWIPTFIDQTFDVQDSVPPLIGTTFSAGCLVALLLGSVLLPRISRKLQAIVICGSMLCNVLVCGVLLYTTARRAPGENGQSTEGLPFSSALLVLFGFTLALPVYIPMSVFSLDFGGDSCSLLIGILDGMAYSAALLFDLSLGFIVDGSNGWVTATGILLTLSVVGFVSLLGFQIMDIHVRAKSIPDLTFPVSVQNDKTQ